MRLALMSLLMIPLAVGCGGGGEADADIGWTAVSAGAGHSCGVTTSGSIECWMDLPEGYTDFGQASPPSGSFQSVSAGGEHSCGVTTSGSIECWGSDSYGQASPPEL